MCWVLLRFYFSFSLSLSFVSLVPFIRKFFTSVIFHLISDVYSVVWGLQQHWAASLMDSCRASHFNVYCLSHLISSYRLVFLHFRCWFQNDKLNDTFLDSHRIRLPTISKLYGNFTAFCISFITKWNVVHVSLFSLSLALSVSLYLSYYCITQTLHFAHIWKMSNEMLLRRNKMKIERTFV